MWDWSGLRWLNTGLCALAASVLLGSLVQAESDAVCRQYAKNAVDAFLEMERSRCGLREPPRWQSNPDAHYNWCRTAPALWLNSEEGFRQNQLRVCRREPAAVDCDEYAKSANSQQTSNLNAHCGFTGARWQNNYDAHLSWCLSMPIAAANSEWELRLKMLSLCGRDQSAIRCDQYAQQAVAQAEEAAARNCSFGGQPQGRWSPSYDIHFRWCFSVPTHEAAEETRQREGPLSQCRTTNPVRGGSVTPAVETCAWSVAAKNLVCANTDGTRSSIATGHLSAPGCGSNPNIASQRAKLNFAASHACVTEGDAPSAGCCTVGEELVQGCLCR